MRSFPDSPGRSESVSREAVWVDSDEQKDSARALEMLHVQLISAVIDPYSWKWVMVAMPPAATQTPPPVATPNSST